MSNDIEPTAPALDWKLVLHHQPTLTYHGTEQNHFYETEEAALVEYARIEDVLKRKRARENDVPKEVEVISLEGRATYPVDDLHFVRVVNNRLLHVVGTREDIEHAANKARAVKDAEAGPAA